MDPVEVLEGFDRAMAAGDRTAVAELADLMVGWFEKDEWNPFSFILATSIPKLAWCRSLSRGQLTNHFRTVRDVARMV
jgi:hypothetical protein